MVLSGPMPTFSSVSLTRLLLGSFILFTAPFATQASETFLLKEFGISLSTPTGWVQDHEETFGTVLKPENPVHSSHKIRIHFASQKADTLDHVALRTLEEINKRRSQLKTPQPAEVILASGPVKTKSGIVGWKSAHSENADLKAPYIIHYYFRHPQGRTICVCAYTMSKEDFAKTCDQIILDTLNFIK